MCTKQYYKKQPGAIDSQLELELYLMGEILPSLPSRTNPKSKTTKSNRLRFSVKEVQLALELVH
jgi:hypothetical protein